MVCCECSAEYEGRANSKYCSQECRVVVARRRARDWYAEHGEGEAFRARVKAATRRHYDKVIADPELKAARFAATAEWRRNNPEKMREAERAWVDANRDRKRAKDQRRRARLLNAYVEDVDPAFIWARDDGICGICSAGIDPDIEWPNKFSRTLDHIIPLARGGLHEAANIQLAHAVCNSRKSDRLHLSS